MHHLKLGIEVRSGTRIYRIMDFTDQELSAIFVITKLMIYADGKADEFEKGLMIEETERLHIPEDKFAELWEASDMEKESEAIAIVSGFDPDKKKYVSALLGSLMAIDRENKGKERTYWGRVCEACQLPKMTLNEATAYIRQRMLNFVQGK